MSKKRILGEINIKFVRKKVGFNIEVGGDIKDQEYEETINFIAAAITEALKTIKERAQGGRK